MKPLKGIFHITVATAAFLSLTPALAYAQTRVVLRDGSIAPPAITASANKTLHIDIVNSGSQVHNFVIPDFYVFTSNLSPGEHTYVEFKPDKKGSFPYYSDKKGVPEPGMSGTLTVTS